MGGFAFQNSYSLIFVQSRESRAKNLTLDFLFLLLLYETFIDD